MEFLDNRDFKIISFVSVHGMYSGHGLHNGDISCILTYKYTKYFFIM